MTVIKTKYCAPPPRALAWGKRCCLAARRRDSLETTVDQALIRGLGNRLVAAELERRWEAALMEVRAAEAALAEQTTARQGAQSPVGKALDSKVVALAGRLPRIWNDPAITDAQRKALLRCLVEKVVLDRGAHDITLARIVWRGGAVTDLNVKMKVNSVAKLSRGHEMHDRVLELAQRHALAAQLAMDMRPVRLGRAVRHITRRPRIDQPFKVSVGKTRRQRPTQAQFVGALKVAPKGGAPDRQARRNLARR